MKKNLIAVCFILLSFCAPAQNLIKWPNDKKALIVLTYDDALVSQLDIAIPQLDKANLKGTFFLKEPATEQHISRWRAASKNGHELGNHTVYHPCNSSVFPADVRYYSENYSVGNMIREISTMNKMLTALDSKTIHTYAYPCGETSVGGKSYVDSLRKSGFVNYARGIGFSPIVTDFKKLDPMNVPCMGFSTNGPASEIINFIKQVQQNKGMGVIIFHGVGGDYLEVSAAAHQQMIQYLASNSKDIWVTTFEDAMNFVTKNSK